MDDLAFSASVLERLPLADGVWRVLHFVMADSWLSDVWQRERGRCYEKDLKFSTLAHLVADALWEHDGSGRQAFERRRKPGRCRSRSARLTTSSATCPFPSARR